MDCFIAMSHFEPPSVFTIALTMLHGVGPIRAKQLIQIFGTPESIFSPGAARILAKYPYGKNIATQIQQGEALRKAEQELGFMTKHDIHAVSFESKHYPQRLLHCTDAPLVMYWKGRPCWNNPHTIAVVGTRRPSHEGIAITQKFIREIVPNQPTIISGLAYGIDYAAHLESLNQKIPTIGVVANPLHFIYPRQHTKLAESMLENGAIISEFPSFTRMLPDLFPMRNRIVAGLCDALLVIQTKRQGGSMITAKIAHSYHREILACPGSIMDPFHEGCNELIQSNMAGMLLNTQDIEHALGCHPQKIPQQLNLFEPEHELQREIYAVLQQGMTTADDLSFQIQKPIGEVLVALMELELLNAIQCLPGKCYALK